MSQDNKKDRTFCVCVNEDDAHIPDSILVHCIRCKRKVWQSLHNVDKEPICHPCALEFAQEQVLKGEQVSFGITPEDARRSLIEIEKIEKKRKEIFDYVLKHKPAWRTRQLHLKSIIDMADRDGNGMKRVQVSNGKTYLVPIEDIICYGLKEEEVPTKYKEMTV